MLVFVLVDAIATFLGVMLSFLPKVTTLPVIFGFDIDATLLTGFGQLHDIMAVVWPLQIVLQGLAALFAYYSMKIGIKIFLGSRTPVND